MLLILKYLVSEKITIVVDSVVHRGIPSSILCKVISHFCWAEVV